ncbi:hypothetical protein COS64_00715 [archaeon CG06_land_8_20_14_3_00_37_11]|nr:MAG: hypothetical protein COS64_00715 [archaeon CG06_land_8_20_14_3_00_37_11]
MNENQINLLIREYNELFSDFDSRNYEDKALSSDFLAECRKASKDKKKAELILSMPKNKRNPETEKIITKRLNNHFSKHFQLLKKDKQKIILKGITSTLISGIFLITSILLHYYYPTQNTLILNSFFVIIEPTGIFFLWKGLELALFKHNKISDELKFYHIMSESRIIFKTFSKE